MSRKKKVRKKPRNDFIVFLKKREQKREWIACLILYGILFFLILYAYPYPDTFPDTGNYILCAQNMEIGGYRPFGYSWFLNFVHRFSSSVHAVFYAQFLLNAVASLFLIFTIKYFFPPVKNYIFVIASLLIILCPSSLYLTNYLMSDSVFTSLTMIWTATAIWLIRGKNILIFLFHIISLYLIIQVRYSGLFFPVFSMILIFYKWGRPGKILWIVPVIVFGYIYSDTKEKTKEAIGVEAFSAFSGWQLANNALHVVPYIDLEPDDIRNRNNRYIHSVVMSTDSSAFPQKGITTTFMWDDELPLKTVFREIWMSQKMGYVQAWVYSGKIFKRYGSFLISKFPVKYFRHYVIYNIQRIFYPPLEVFRNYAEIVPEEPLTTWFKLGEEERFIPRWNFFAPCIAPLLPALNLAHWILAIAFLVFAFFKRRMILFSRLRRDAFVFLFAFIIVYLAFHVIASPVSLRYLTPVFFVKVMVPYVLINAMITPPLGE